MLRRHPTFTGEVWNTPGIKAAITTAATKLDPSPADLAVAVIRAATAGDCRPGRTATR